MRTGLAAEVAPSLCSFLRSVWAKLDAPERSVSHSSLLSRSCKITTEKPAATESSADCVQAACSAARKTSVHPCPLAADLSTRIVLLVSCAVVKLLNKNVLIRRHAIITIRTRHLDGTWAARACELGVLRRALCARARTCDDPTISSLWPLVTEFFASEWRSSFGGDSVNVRCARAARRKKQFSVHACSSSLPARLCKPPCPACVPRCLRVSDP